jgi:predicted molibdopterin-dependent oxidoreductase YjgC
MKRTIGVAASTCSYRDWYGTDLVIFFGSNPANDQPVSVKYIHEAKKLGTKVVLVNPYREPGMDRYWVPSIASSALFGTDVVQKQASIDDFVTRIEIGKQAQITDDFMIIARIESLILEHGMDDAVRRAETIRWSKKA